MGLKLTGLAGVLALILLFTASASDAAFRYGHLVQIEQLSFDPDTTTVPGDSFAVLVIQNREEGPIQHEVRSKDLFEPGTLISVHGTGKIEYEGKRVSRVLLFPGEEVVIWYYAAKGLNYTYQCNLNGHSMQGTVQAV
jgi:plastocyanin